MRRGAQRFGGRTRQRLVLAVLAAAVLAPVTDQAVGRNGAAEQSTATRAFETIADASIAAYDDDQNYGRQAVLRVDGQPLIRSYLKFKLKGLTGSVRAATLQLYVRRSMTARLEVHGVADSSWNERRITFENAPDFDPAIAGSAIVFKSSRWVSIDVTPLVSGDGLMSMALTTPDIHLLLFAGREAGPFDPRLVVETSPKPPNRPPVAQPDASSALEDTPLVLAPSTLTANDTDPDGDALSVTGVAGGASTHGTVSLGPDGVRYEPALNFNGSASFTYTVADGHGGTATGTVGVTVSPVNDAPVATDDAGSTDEDTPLRLAALTANDTDADGDALAVTAVAAGPETHGTVSLGADGVTYEPDANFNGSASFGYTVDDGHGATATGTVRVTVRPVNDAPVAVDDAASTAEDTPLTLAASSLTANDTDVEGDALSVTDVAAGPGTHGNVSLDAGAVTYEPDANFNGAASFTYTVGDGHGGTASGTVSITVEAVNDPPVGIDDTASTAEDTPLVLRASALTANDLDPDADVLSLTAVAGGPDTHGSVSLGPDGVRYEPAANYNGPASFAYTLGDGHGGTATASVAVTVEPVNDPPVAGDDAAATAEDTPVTLGVSSLTTNDGDVEGDTLSVTAVAGGPDAHGSVSLGPDGVRYEPAANYNGPASFTYTLDDGQGGTATGTVIVTVEPANDAPAPADDAKVTDRDIPLAFPAADLLANDTDPDGDPLTVTGVAAGADSHGTVALGGGGLITYAPVASYVGEASFMYTVNDGHGGTAVALVHMSVVVVSATVETAPVPHSGDAADDPAIWVNPADPAASAVIGTDKQGGIAVYDLAGTQLQYLADGKMNNVDLRDGFPLGGHDVTLVVADDRSGSPAARKWRIQPYVLDPATRQLGDVAARSIQTAFEPYGLCMYHSPSTGKFYVFVTSRNATADGGVVVQQWELKDNGAGRVDAAAVRTLVVGGGEVEGCVADDGTGALYVSDEDVALWRYGAEPDAGSGRTAVDTTGSGGHLTADVEGLAIAYGPGTSGYLIASSQGSNSYVVYRRDGANAYVRTFAIRGAGSIDGTSDTDGIDVTTKPLGPAFPNGLFVAQDGSNCITVGSGSCSVANQQYQNFKLVPWSALRLPLDGS